MTFIAGIPNNFFFTGPSWYRGDTGSYYDLETAAPTIKWIKSDMEKNAEIKQNFVRLRSESHVKKTAAAHRMYRQTV